MARQLLAVRLVPADVFTRLLDRLRSENPGAHITAVAASEQVAGAEEALDWRRLGGRRLARELRRRRFDLVVLAHGQDHYATRAYWRAVLLASLTGAREVVLCEQGRLDRRHSVLAGAARAVLQAVEETYGAALALLVLLPVVVMAVVTDLTEGTSLAIGRRRG